MNIFHEILVNQLAIEGRFISDEGELKKFVIIDAAFNMDRTLIGLLLTKKELKQKFFTEIAGHWVFDINLFVRYMENKNFLKDSYTRYRNKIGLTIGEKFLNQRNDVALVWPFKDCILEGGQTEEDQKRPEIFFNDILAQEEIDQLTEPKILVNWEKYTTDGTQKVTEIKRSENGIIKDNLIIKGNNLLALHSLLLQFENQVKLIYIDPPYNTGNDAFKYNDSFSHSTWLTFMKNRLEVAHKFLKRDGLIFIHIDDVEESYLKILCDEIFGREKFVNTIAVKSSTPSGIKTAHKDKTIIKQKDFILVYKKSDSVKIKPQYTKRENWDTHFSRILDKDENGKYILLNLKDILIKEGILNKSNTLNDLDINDKKFKKFYLKNADKICQSAAHKNKEIDKISRKEYPDAVYVNYENDKIKGFYYNGRQLQPLSYSLNEIIVNKEITKDFSMLLCDFWSDIDFQNTQNEGGGISFPAGKKPELLLYRIIDMASKPDDIVLDFFAGSGTTGAVAHKMNRQYILIEQMDYIKDLPEARLKKVIGIKTKKTNELHEKIEFDTGGISKALKWKGGGSFIYTELKQYNQAFINQIETAKTTNELIAIWEEMKIHSFLNYNVDIKKHDENIEEFKTLEIQIQKEHLLKLLNKNQLYVNLSSIDDEDFKVSDENKKLTNEFYEIKEEEAVTQTKIDL